MCAPNPGARDGERTASEDREENQDSMMPIHEKGRRISWRNTSCSKEKEV